MEINDFQDHVAVDAERIRRAVIAAAGERNPAISISIVDNATIHALNRQHLGHDRATDVIAFDYSSDSPSCEAPDSSSDDVDGEVIASAEQAVIVGDDLGRDPFSELLLYIIHGVLHLQGFDDHGEDEKKRMRAREKEVCSELGMEDPWPE